ncbi:MAG: response regulator transcription factor [Bacilli bacterium]
MTDLDNALIRVLIVDDEPTIAQFLELGLVHEGYQVCTVNDGLAAVSTAKQFQPHVVVLDVMMPGMDGYEACQVLKSLVRTSVIMLTAKEEVPDRIRGLDGGADDYMVKPFSFQELLARIKARVRNQFPELADAVTYGSFRLESGRHEIWHQGKLLQLSPTEYRLLRYLILNHGLVMSKQIILEKVWGYDFGGEENIVEVYVRSLREKLQDKEHKLIRTVRGVGYRVDTE